MVLLPQITSLNDGTIISVAYDNVEASLKPQAWDLKILYLRSQCSLCSLFTVRALYCVSKLLLQSVPVLLPLPPLLPFPVLVIPVRPLRLSHLMLVLLPLSVL